MNMLVDCCEYSKKYVKDKTKVNNFAHEKE